MSSNSADLAATDVESEEVSSWQLVSSWWLVSNDCLEESMTEVDGITDEDRVCVISIVKTINVAKVSFADGSCKPICMV